MEKYDVVIIGGGLGSLTTATYLSKRLRNVAVFEQQKDRKLESYSKRFRDSENSNFKYTFHHHDMGGVHRGDLFYEYLKQCGIANKFEFYDNFHTMIVTRDRQLVRRPNNMKDFKTYLVRRYPKQRDEIHRLFTDIMAHYKDFRVQKQARLINAEFTLSSVLIEWGDLSLRDVLEKYISDERVIDEFTLTYNSVGLQPEDINAYHYFIKWFDTFIDGNHFITTSYDQIVQTLTTEISKTREKIFMNRSIKDVIIKNDKIVKVIDDDDNVIEARHFIINMRTDEFVDRYAPKRLDIKEKFLSMYPKIEVELFVNQAYIGLNCAPEEIDMFDSQYIFSEVEDDAVRILSIINYKAYDDKACPDGKTALLVEFVDDNTPRKTKLEEVVSQLLAYFPKAKDHITLQRIGAKIPYMSSLASPEYWEGKTINDLFEIDDYSDINPFPNAYFIGSWMKPEAGITGIIQTGVEYGDIIDDLIYHGEDDDYFINHDELMNIINHQFIPNSLGKVEKNIQFFIGKDSYYIRTKGAHQRLYKGVSDISDIIIIATNETLYDLSVGNTTLDKAISNGTLEYVGSEEFLNEVMEAFDMGIEITKPITYQYVQGKWGNIIFLVQMALLLISNLLANYHYNVIIGPVTLALFGGTVYFKYRMVHKISVFEYFVLGLYFILSVLSIFIPYINEMKDAKYTLGIFSIYLLGTWLINRPLAYSYIRHDYRTDYTRTKLFVKMSGGLTFIWGMTFFVILIMDITLIRSYASLAYYMIPLSFYLSIFYPSSYITGYID
ncbi:NAD(P)-binding protein [Candidatus Xianfuyuplasma coldseepsis]|uniref:NAD(P)-binding protein n=1 Tax=Candidatus Xianfuyuplasma coldseepsis TaxID=2782163 RepID=A0A7L7KQ40_9MOLU|nr:NAD(P)-binding protein [Xianfuyuplasma coldseepsis]QMS84910.1 NAD(P)-binding protein [Xianfuyuplasma coldseepsis]